MRFTIEIESELNKKFGKKKWKIRHALNWAESLKAAKAKGLDPTKAWAVSILKNKVWTRPTHAVKHLNDLKEVV